MLRSDDEASSAHRRKTQHADAGLWLKAVDHDLGEMKSVFPCRTLLPNFKEDGLLRTYIELLIHKALKAKVLAAALVPQMHPDDQRGGRGAPVH